VRILDVAPWVVVPPIRGAAIRAYQTLRHLSERHEIRIFSQPRRSLAARPGFETFVEAGERMCEYRYPSRFSALVAERCTSSWLYQYVPASDVLSLLRPRRLRDWLAWCDVCLVEFPWQFAHCRRALPDRPVVYASHNVELDTRSSIAVAAGLAVEGNRWLRYIRRLESRAVASADLIVAVSEADRQRFVELYGADPDRIVIVPNGSDTTSFSPAEPGAAPGLRRELGLPDRPTVVFMAAGPKVPDLAALAWVRRLAPLVPEATFLVVGGVSPRLTEGNLVATGFVDDPVSHLRASDVAIAPVEFGGGTKLKIFDSLACGLATAVFAEAAHGTDLRDGEHVLMAPKEERGLATAVRRLLEDEPLAARLGSAGRAFVVERHDWRVGARTLEAALARLVPGER
jgi:glycosyltransferase involved in cell wall biosynthesis